MSVVDKWMEASSRRLARRMGRRSFLGKLGAAIAGSAVLPLLPVARGNAEGSRAGAPPENITGP